MDDIKIFAENCIKNGKKVEKVKVKKEKKDGME